MLPQAFGMTSVRNAGMKAVFKWRLNSVLYDADRLSLSETPVVTFWPTTL